MKSKKDTFIPNEYRTGGSFLHNSSNTLFAVGTFVVFALLGIILTACLLILRVSATDQHKVIAALSIPQETQYSGNEPHMDGLVLDCKELGLTCQAISEFCQQYYELPPGVYIVRVAKNSPAAFRGILPGDILVRANGQAICSPAELQEIIHTCPAGTLLSLDVIRKEKIFTVYFTPGV
jgi:membrane-associated protease RseP (regulator of RpoE activity)